MEIYEYLTIGIFFFTNLDNLYASIFEFIYRMIAF